MGGDTLYYGGRGGRSEGRSGGHASGQKVFNLASVRPGTSGCQGRGGVLSLVPGGLADEEENLGGRTGHDMGGEKVGLPGDVEQNSEGQVEGTGRFFDPKRKRRGGMIKKTGGGVGAGGTMTLFH